MLLLPDREQLEHWMLDRLLRRAGLKREQLLLVATQDPTQVTELMQRHGIKVLVPMGRQSCQLILGDSDILRWLCRLTYRNDGLVITSLGPLELLVRRGQPLPVEGEEEDDEPTWRKAKVIRNPPRYMGVCILALQRAVHYALNGPPPADPPVDYLLDPPPQAFELWVSKVLECHARGELRYPLSVDIETAFHLKQKDKEDQDLGLEKDKQIIRWSFTVEPFTAVSVPNSGEYKAAITRLLESDIPKLGWNSWTFDEPIIRLNKLPFEGVHYDGQDAFHVLYSDTDKGIEFVTGLFTQLQPWKHLADSAPALYACKDADAALRCWIAIKQKLEQRGQWDHYIEQYVRLHPVLRRAGRRGIPVDNNERLKLGELLDHKAQEVDVQVQAVVPDKFRPRQHYKRTPWPEREHKNISIQAETGQYHWKRDVYAPDGSVAVELRRFEPVPAEADIKICSVCLQPASNKSVHFKGTTTMVPNKKGELKLKRVPNPCKAAGATIIKARGAVTEWDELQPFNPNSTKQLMAYVKGHGHPVGQNWKTKEESIDKKHLALLTRRYGKKFPLYPLTQEAHLLSKAKGTYVDGMAPDELLLVYTTYVNAPSTGRLASRNVNLQNVGKRNSNPYAKKARRIFVAGPGYCLVQADSSAIEAVNVGFFMGDHNYIQLAKRSIHAYVCCRKLGWEFTPENVERVKEHEKTLYDQIKITVHGSSYGATPYLLHMNMPDTFPTLRDAEDAQRTLFEVLPGLPAWQYQVRLEARKNGYLTNPWGGRHEFYDVFTWQYDDQGNLIVDPITKQPKVKLGQDGKRCVAFKPQSSAGMFMRDTLVLIGETDWEQYLPANCSVHDSVLLRVPVHLRDKAIEFLIQVMTRPVPQLGGLSIGCEVEVSKENGNWLEMEKVATVSMIDPGWKLAA